MKWGAEMKRYPQDSEKPVILYRLNGLNNWRTNGGRESGK
jgi:hypothetical protein